MQNFSDYNMSHYFVFIVYISIIDRSVHWDKFCISVKGELYGHLFANERKVQSRVYFFVEDELLNEMIYDETRVIDVVTCKRSDLLVGMS